MYINPLLDPAFGEHDVIGRYLAKDLTMFFGRTDRSHHPLPQTLQQVISLIRSPEPPKKYVDTKRDHTPN